MNKKHTAETLMVQPINTDKLKQYLSSFYILEENQDLSIYSKAIVKNKEKVISINKDCCGFFLEKRWDNNVNKTDFFLDIEMQIQTKNGSITQFSQMDHAHSISLTTLIEQEILDPECPLKEFMGSRYNYNPRIAKNTRLILAEINEN